MGWINETFGAEIEDNAADAYRLADAKMTRFRRDWGETLEGPWSEDADVSAWLEANREALQLFRSAAMRDDCFFARRPHSDAVQDSRVAKSIFLSQLPRLGLHRDAAKGLIAAGYRAWADGEAFVLLDNAMIVVRAGHHLTAGTTLVARLTGQAMSNLAYKAMLDALRRTEDPETLALHLLSNLQASDPTPPPFLRHVRFERLVLWDVCQRLFVPGERDGTWRLHEPYLHYFFRDLRDLYKAPGTYLAPLSTADRIEVTKLGFESTVREVNDYFDAVETWVQTPYHLAGVDGRATGCSEKFTRVAEQTKNPAVKILLPSLTRARELDERFNATRNATHLILNLFVHRHEHGKFPKSLSALHVRDLSELRTDPFSGKDLIYKRKRRGKSFLLYSVSDNGVDDNGEHANWSNDRDFVFWPVQ